MTEDVILRITLAIIIGTLAAIVFCLRVLVLMERRVAKIEEHMDKLVHKVLKEEVSLRGLLAKKKKKR